jgi:hypothetical protein
MFCSRTVDGIFRIANGGGSVWLIFNQNRISLKALSYSLEGQSLEFAATDFAVQISDAGTFHAAQNGRRLAGPAFGGCCYGLAGACVRREKYRLRGCAH